MVSVMLSDLLNQLRTTSRTQLITKVLQTVERNDGDFKILERIAPVRVDEFQRLRYLPLRGRFSQPVDADAEPQRAGEISGWLFVFGILTVF